MILIKRLANINTKQTKTLLYTMTHEEAMEDDFQVPLGNLPTDKLWMRKPESTPEEGYWKKRCEDLLNKMEQIRTAALFGCALDDDPRNEVLKNIMKLSHESNPPEYNQDELWQEIFLIVGNRQLRSVIEKLKQSYSITPK